jgi:hypothetical protein
MNSGEALLLIVASFVAIDSALTRWRDRKKSRERGGSAFYTPTAG